MKILTYDSTLRDGEQCEGITLSLEDKLRIVERLDALGIDFIEGGFPASNPKDIAFFQRVQTLPLRHARIAAFGSTCKKALLPSKTKVLLIWWQAGLRLPLSWEKPGMPRSRARFRRRLRKTCE